MQDLILHYTRTGIIQFGRFQQPDGSFHPVSFNFLLLPSYPALMQATARALLPIIQSNPPERLLTTRAAIPLGSVLAVESGIALTYPYGEEKAYTIEGAYDVGHPTTLLTYILSNGAEELALIETAAKVGLRVQQIICLFQIGHYKKQPEHIVINNLFKFDKALEQLVKQNWLTGAMQHTVKQWLQRESM